MSKITELFAVCLKGASLDFRRDETSWPKPYRARTFVTKNERAEHRVVGWGDTAEEAAGSALDQIRAIKED